MNETLARDDQSDSTDNSLNDNELAEDWALTVHDPANSDAPLEDVWIAFLGDDDPGADAR